MRQRNYPQRGADARRRQAAGIAVGQQAARRHQRAARLGDAGAKLFILFDQAQRFRFQAPARFSASAPASCDPDYSSGLPPSSDARAACFQRLR